MDSSPKRRARFRKGVTPPPLTPAEPIPTPLSWHEQHKLKKAQAEARRQEQLRNRLPLPEPAEIRERVVEATLRFFAQADPNFWLSAIERKFYYPSDFLGKHRLGRHLESYGKIMEACREISFPVFRHGMVETTVPPTAGTELKDETPAYCFRLSENSEWIDALSELCAHLGIPVESYAVSDNAQMVIDFAAKVPQGKEGILPSERLEKWNYYDRERAVDEAQVSNPRIFLTGGGYRDSQIHVGKQPLPWLVLPSLDSCLDFPTETTKATCDVLSKRIQQIVQAEFHAGPLTTDWLVLARTSSRRQALKSFGHDDRDKLAKLASKVKPIGMVTWWEFSARRWGIAVRPDENKKWSQVVEEIEEASQEIPSLSKEASNLFDWLRRLPREELEWELSPELTDEVLKTEIGIENPWEGENAFLFFRLLAGEISRQTPYSAEAHPWKEYSTVRCRIEFYKKVTGA